MLRLNFGSYRKSGFQTSKVMCSWRARRITPNVFRKCCILVPFSSTYSYVKLDFLSWLPSKQRNMECKEIFTVLGLRPNPDFTRLYRNGKSTIKRVTQHLHFSYGYTYRSDTSQDSLLNFPLFSISSVITFCVPNCHTMKIWWEERAESYKLGTRTILRSQLYSCLRPSYHLRKKSPGRQTVVCKSFQNLEKRFRGGELVNVF